MDLRSSAIYTKEELITLLKDYEGRKRKTSYVLRRIEDIKKVLCVFDFRFRFDEMLHIYEIFTLKFQDYCSLIDFLDILIEKKCCFKSRFVESLFSSGCFIATEIDGEIVRVDD